MTLSRRHFCAAAALLLSGCAATRAPGEKRFEGRFSLLNSATRERVTGRFAVTGRKDFVRLDLLTPLSGILARIEVTPNGAELSRGLNAPVERERDAATLMRKRLGFEVPVENLLTWLETPPADAFDAGPWHCVVSARFASGAAKRIRITGNGLLLTLLLDDEEAA